MTVSLFCIFNNNFNFYCQQFLIKKNEYNLLIFNCMYRRIVSASLISKIIRAGRPFWKKARSHARYNRNSSTPDTLAYTHRHRYTYTYIYFLLRSIFMYGDAHLYRFRIYTQSYYLVQHRLRVCMCVVRARNMNIKKINI